MKNLPKTIGLARRLADRLLPLTLVIGFLISVGFPAAYYVLECSALQRTATIYATQMAETLQGSALETPTLWKNQPQEYSQVPADWLPEELVNIEVLDATGQPAGHNHKTQERQAWENRFVFKGPAAIAANRRKIGKVQAGMSHRQLLETTFILLLVCTTIAASLAALIYFFPIKIVRGAEAQLQKMIEAVQASSNESDRLASCAQASEQRFRNLVHGLDVIVWEGDLKTFTFTFVSQRVEEILGYPIQRWLTEPGFFLNLVYPEDHEQFQALCREFIQEGRAYSLEYRITAADGRLVWVCDTFYVVRDHTDQVTQFRGVMVDITDRKQAESELQRSLSLLRATIESTADGILAVDDLGKIVSFNQKFAQMWQIPEPILTAQDDGQAWAFILDQLKDPEGFLTKIQELHSQPDAEGYDIFEFKDGRVFERYSLPQRLGGESIGRVLSFPDITERKVAEEQLRHDACHDALTGLPNRAFFINCLERAIGRSQRQGGNSGSYLFAVLFLDLDRFKVINDSLGHLIGDQLLIAIARRLEACLRPGDLVARLGGDEFTILLENITDPNEATLVAEQIQGSLALPFDLDGQEVFTTASIGISLSDTSEPGDLLRDADTAMYRAKKYGKAHYEVFVQGMHQDVLVALELKNDLRRAIDRQELQVYYQPIVSLQTNQITGLEALLR